MATTETSTLHMMAGVVGIGSLALFGATACDGGGAEIDEGGAEIDEGGAETEGPVDNGELEDGNEMPQDDTLEETPTEDEPMEEESDM